MLTLNVSRQISTRQKGQGFFCCFVSFWFIWLCVCVCVSLMLKFKKNHSKKDRNDSPQTLVYRCAVMCALPVECVAEIYARTHHPPIHSVWQRRQLPATIFYHALFAITVTGRALASLSDFYEHTCRDYWDLWKHCWEMWNCVCVRERENF